MLSGRQQENIFYLSLQYMKCQNTCNNGNIWSHISFLQVFQQICFCGHPHEIYFHPVGRKQNIFFWLNPGDTYRYEVKVGGTSIGTAMNKKAKEFTNVKVFGADNWGNPAQGSIRNLLINPDTRGRILVSCIKSIWSRQLGKPCTRQYKEFGHHPRHER